MKSFDLSIIVPARNEEFLGHTVQDILAHTTDACEIICVLDGDWPVEPIVANPRLTIVYRPVSIGQRAAINEGVMLSRSPYVAKLDAHCALDQDFDQKLIRDYEPGTVVVPRLYNLHVFDWECKACGHRTYQGPYPTTCTNCPNRTEFEKTIVWQPRWNRKTDFMKFDEELKFGYWGSYGERPEVKAQGDIADTMSLLGACFFMSRTHYWNIDGCDELTGSWGQQGTEMSLKAHMYPGSRLRVNKGVWYSHLFRTASGFSFPYPLSHKETDHAKNYSRDFWMNNRWPKASRLLSQVVESYWPIPGWSQEALDKLKDSEKGLKRLAVPSPAPAPQQAAVVNERKYVQSAPISGHSIGICYYTDNRPDASIMESVQRQILRGMNGHQLVSVSLKPIKFGDNITLGLERGWLTLFNQILAGLSLLDTDFVFMAEHDVLYAKDYFSSFVPPRRDRVFYNENVWRVRADTGEALFTYHKSVSQLCGDRRLLIDHYRERIARVEQEGFKFRMGFEPGTKTRKNGGFDDLRSESWFSPIPNIDLWHGKNATKLLWEKSDFRNEKFTEGWTKSPSVPDWPGLIKGRFEEWLAETVK